MHIELVLHLLKEYTITIKSVFEIMVTESWTRPRIETMGIQRTTAFSFGKLADRLCAYKCQVLIKCT